MTYVQCRGQGHDSFVIPHIVDYTTLALKSYFILADGFNVCMRMKSWCQHSPENNKIAVQASNSSSGNSGINATELLATADAVDEAVVAVQAHAVYEETVRFGNDLCLARDGGCGTNFLGAVCSYVYITVTMVVWIMVNAQKGLRGLMGDEVYIWPVGLINYNYAILTIAGLLLLPVATLPFLHRTFLFVDATARCVKISRISCLTPAVRISRHVKPIDILVSFDANDTWESGHGLTVTIHSERFWQREMMLRVELLDEDPSTLLGPWELFEQLVRTMGVMAQGIKWKLPMFHDCRVASSMDHPQLTTLEALINCQLLED